MGIGLQPLRAVRDEQPERMADDQRVLRLEVILAMGKGWYIETSGVRAQAARREIPASAARDPSQSSRGSRVDAPDEPLQDAAPDFFPCRPGPRRHVRDWDCR